MKFSTPSLLFGLSTLVQAQCQTLCAANATLPCLCPNGTQYAESGTFLIAGVGSAPMRAYLGDFFNTTWLNRTLLCTEGISNKVGARRTTQIATDVGVYNFTETLTRHDVSPAGSFLFNYEQTEPIPYSNGQGAFAGWWTVLQGENAFRYQTPMRWSLFACQTGHPIDFAAFAEARLKDMISKFQAQGIYQGDTLGPLSFQRF